LTYLDADLDICRKNDKYGIYELADQGKIQHLAGIDMPFDIPPMPAIVLKAEKKDQHAEDVLLYLSQHKIFPLS
jgi:adenylylsulfate kinase-like enzyme